MTDPIARVPAAGGGAGEGLAGSTLGGYAWSLAGTGAQMGAKLLVVGALGRLLVPGDFGVVAAATIVAAAGWTVGQAGLGEALIQRADLRESHVRTGLSLALVLGILTGALTWWLAPLCAAFFRMDALDGVLRLLALFPVIRIASIPMQSMMARALRFRALAAIDVVSYCLGYAAVSIPLAAAGHGVWALAWGLLGQIALEALLLAVFSHHPLRPGFDMVAARELLWFGGGISILNAAHLLAGQTDHIVTGRRLGDGALGLYSRAFHLFIVPGQILGMAGNRVLFPVMSRIQEERERLGLAARRGIALTALLALPAQSVLLVLAPEIVRVVYGPGWEGAVPVLQAMSLGLHFRTTWGVTLAILRAGGTVYQVAWRHLAYAACVLVATWIACPFGLGWVGAAVSATLALQFVLASQLLIRTTGLSATSLLRAHAEPLALGLACLVIAWFSAGALREGHFGPVAVVLVAGSLVAIGASTLAAFLPAVFLGPDGRWFLGVLGQRLRGVLGRRSEEGGG